MNVLTLLLASVAPAGDWSYVVPPEEGRRPPLCALPLSNEPPEELRVQVEFTGEWQRYGMLRYGDPDSTRIAVVLDHRSLRDFDLYVDVDRDLAIDAADRVEGTERSFELALAVATRDAEGRDQLVPRRVLFEQGRSGAVFGVATLGGLEGEIELGGKRVRVLRRDGDANGFFSDAHDQLWIDRDGSGEFAPLAELFVVQPILSLAGERFTVRTDRIGTDLALEPLEGTGRVRLELMGPEGVPRTDVDELQALLVGRDGSAVLASTVGGPTEVPVGEYRLGVVTARIKAAGGTGVWSFVFSEGFGGSELRWHEVAKDAELAIDPVGELAFRLVTMSPTTSPGGRLSARPTLHTADGLRVNSAYLGREAPAWGGGGLQATVELIDSGGTLRATASSGFA